MMYRNTFHREEKNVFHAHVPAYLLQGYLMHRIVGNGQLHDPCRKVCICLASIPPNRHPPFTLESIVQTNDFTCRIERECAVVTASLLCNVRDACGSMFSAEAAIDFSVPFRLLPSHKACTFTCCATGNIGLKQCVQSKNACFAANLDVRLDVYATIPEVCLHGGCPPPCPPSLPWYPQPCRKHV